MAEERFKNPTEAFTRRQDASLTKFQLPRGRELSIFVGIWLFAFLLRVIYLAQIKDAVMFPIMMGDARSYDAWAQEIAGGEWLGHEVFYQAPLYPYFLGVIYTILGRDFLLLRLVQVILGATSCLLIALAGRLFFCRSVGILAGVLLALYPSAIYFDCLIQKSVLDLFFLSLFLFACGVIGQNPRSGWLVAGGAILGFLTLSRENALILAFVTMLWLIVRLRHQPLGSRMKSAGFFLAGLALVLFPVAVRNKVVGGEFHLTTAQFGPNLYIGNNKDANGLYAPLRPGRADTEFERQDYTQVAETALGRKLSPSEVSSYWTRRALSYMRSDPVGWLRLTARKWFLVWNAIEIPDTEDQYTYCDSSALLRWLTRVFHFGILCPLGLFGVMVAWTIRDRIWVLYLMLASYAAAATLSCVYGRYRFPLVAWLVMFAAAGLVEAYDLFLRKKLAPLVVAGGLAVVTGLLVNRRPFTENDCRAMGRRNIGTSLLKEPGRVEEAIAHFRVALQYHPDLAQAHLGLGEALAKQEKLDDAVAEFVEALKLQSDLPDAHYNLAAALTRQGKIDAAIIQYEDALRLDPDLATAHSDLASAFISRGQFDQAIAHSQEALRLKPDLAEAHYNLATALVGEGKIDLAIPHYTEALRLRPDLAEAHFNLGNVLVMRGQLEPAIAQYQEALRIKPDFSAARNNLGFALASQGRFQEAIAQYTEALRLQPTNADAQYNWGVALAAQGKPSEAMGHFTEALRSNPDHVAALNDSALMLATDKDERLRNSGEAVRLASRACELTGYRDPAKLDTLAMAYAEAGRFQDAIQTAQKAVDLAVAAGNQELARAIRNRLELYKAGKPFRE